MLSDIVGWSGVGLASVVEFQSSFLVVKENWSCVMTRHYTESSINVLLTRNVPLTVKPSFNDITACGLKDMACEENEQEYVMPIIIIADILANAPCEKVSVVITKDDE